GGGAGETKKTSTEQLGETKQIKIFFVLVRANRRRNTRTQNKPNKTRKSKPFSLKSQINY
ncbi:hypothetical protein NP570_23730, partial [Vibrio parahaemolyticus]|nr:hypothetical protein [Vibrio parahaemolyticus]